MFGATIANIITAKENHNSQSFVPSVEVKETKTERLIRLDNERNEAAKQKEISELFHTRKLIINERNAAIQKIQHDQSVRKDGLNVARPGKKEERDSLRLSLRQINKRIDAINSIIAKKQGVVKRELTDRELEAQARRERDEYIVTMLHVEKINPLKCDQDLRDIGLELAYQARPEHGYPMPPFRRGDDYPNGAMDMPGPTDFLSVTGERDRLFACIMNIVSREGYSDRVDKMANHLERLNSYVEFLSRESYITKKQGTKEYSAKNIESNGH